MSNAREEQCTWASTVISTGCGAVCRLLERRAQRAGKRRGKGVKSWQEDDCQYPTQDPGSQLKTS